jgi:hypothetical protein
MTMDTRMLTRSTANMIAELKGMLRKEKNKMKLERAYVLRRRNKAERFTHKGRHTKASDNEFKKGIIHEQDEEMLEKKGEK